MELIQIHQGDETMMLHGEGVEAPFWCALLRSPGSLEAAVTSELELVLEGTAAQIEDGLQRLGRLLERAGRWAHVPGGAYAMLEVRVSPTGDLWRSKILRGWVELGGMGASQRCAGSQAIKLVLERENAWEGPETLLPLTNASGARVTGGVTVYNHSDSAVHQNYADLAADDAVGTLPAPVRLVLNGVDMDSSGTVYAAQTFTAPSLVHQLEGENGEPGTGVTRSVMADTNASGGAFARLGWNGESEVTAWKSDLVPEAVAAYGGRPFLPVLRLVTPLSGVDIWHSWRQVVSWNGAGQATYDSAGSYLKTQVHHSPGAAVFLPPWPVAAGEYPPGMSVELRAQASGAGSHTLDLDCVYFLPLDAWRVYRPTVGAWSGLKIVDDPYAGTLKAGDWAIQMHTAEGPGLVVYPGRASRYYFLFERSGGGFLPGASATVQMAYRPRKREL